MGYRGGNKYTKYCLEMQRGQVFLIKNKKINSKNNRSRRVMESNNQNRQVNS